MRKANNSLGLFVLSFFIAFGTVGCDQIASIKQYFTKADEKPEKKAAAQSAAAPASHVPAKKAGQKAMGPNDLARVGNWTITIEEFNERLQALKEVVPETDVESKEVKELILEELVRQQLLVIDAEQRGVDKDKDIKAAVDEFRRTLLVREVARQLTQGLEVTEEEARDFYEQRKDVLIQPAQWRIREIVVDTQLQANEISVELLKGADFAQTATQRSISGSAAKGGDLGFVNNVAFSEMADALLALEEGEMSSVFKGPEGYYIIKLEEKKGGDPLVFDEIKDDLIQNQLLLKQQQALLDHLNKLQQKVKIEVNQSLLE